jgi:PKHD-type hydroxylase
MKYAYYYISDFISCSILQDINKILDSTNNQSKLKDIPANVNKTSSVRFYKYEILWDLLKDFRHEVLNINNKYFGFKIFKPSKNTYLNINTYEKGQEYNWHIDATYEQASDIKLTVLLNISNIEYSGGNFVIFQSGEHKIEQFDKPGTILVFPSYIPHKVTPVLSGTRQTLTWFLEGPNWK